MACESDKPENSKKDKNAFPADAYEKVKDSVTATENALNEKLITDLTSVYKEALDLSKKMMGLAPENEKEKADALAKTIGLKDAAVLAEKLIVLGSAIFCADTLKDIQKEHIDTGYAKMMPDMIFNPIRTSIKKAKLTKADLELTLKQLETLKTATDVLTDIGTAGKMLKMGVK
jgi:hypothetical protein